ncbi:MAG: hypothetical protein OHK0036_03760 [Bacteroidia bacterium]
MITRILILLTAFTSLMVGLITGVSRTGYWNLLTYLSPYHFLLMTGSFFGTLITLERAVTLHKKLLHSIPFINGLSLIFFLFKYIDEGIIFLMLGGCIMIMMYLYFYFQHKNFENVLFIISALAYFIGFCYYYIERNLVPTIRWIEIFFLLTIVAERLELSRFLNVSKFKKQMLLLFILFSLLSSFTINHLTNILFGISILCISIWLILYDVAKINIRKNEPHKFRGWALMLGYYWLFIHGLTFILDFINYDLQIHSFFLGFIMNMIFAHITIILPAIFKITYQINHKIYYFIWIIFQLILLIRFAIYTLNPINFGIIALINTIAVILFFILNAYYLLCRKL